MINFSDTQLSLILCLVESEKYDILSDIENEDFDAEGKQSGLTKASFSVLQARFWELARIEELIKKVDNCHDV